MEKNYDSQKNSGKNLKKILLTFVLFLSAFVFTSKLFAQSCTVNANDLNLQYCTNQTMLLGVGGGTGGAVDGVLWQQLSGPSVSIVDATVIPAQFIGAVPGTYTFSLIADCTAGDQSLTQLVTVTVFEISTSDAGNDIAACPGDYALNANTPGPNETGEWEFIGGNPAGAIISDVNNPNATVNFPPTASGVSTLQWTISTNAGVNINPAPDTGETICSSSDSVTLTNYGGQTAVTASGANPGNCYTTTTGTTLIGSNGGTGLGGQTRQWDFVSGPTLPAGFPAYSQNVSVGGLVEGSYTFRYSVTGPCASGEDTVTIEVPPATQDISEAGPSINQVYCQGTVDSAVLTGNAPVYAGEIVNWQQIAGPLVNEATTLNTPFATTSTTSVTGLNGIDTYRFLYTISGDPLLNPDCSDTKTVTISFYNDTPVIELNGGDDVFILPVNDTDGSVPITNVTGGNAYSIQQLAGPVTVPTSSLQIVGANFNFQDLTLNGTYTFEVTRYSQGEVATGCNTASDIINIIVSLAPDAANAGTDTFFPCGITSGPVAGNVPTPGIGGIGLWSQISGPSTATIVDPTNNNTTVNGLLNPGSYVFRWSITGGPAGTDTFDDVTIYITLDNASNAGTDRLRPANDICPTNYITDAAPLLPGQMGTWTIVTAETYPGLVPIPVASYPVFADLNNPITEVTGLQPDANYVFRWTVEASTTAPVNPNPCLPIFDDVTVETNANLAPSFAEAGDGDCFPSGTTTATLGATAPAIGIGTWSLVSGPNTPAEMGSNDPNVTVTGLIAGTYEFMWTTSNAACQEFTDSVIITVVGTPSVADASVNDPNRLNLCFVDIAATSVTMDANTPTVGTGTWVQVAGNGGWTATAAFPATYPNPLNDPQVTFSNLSEGAYQFEWQVAQGTCDSDSDTVDFSVYYEPAQPEAGIAQGICYDPAAPIAVNLAADPLPAGSNGTWSVVSGPNSPTIDTPTSPTSSISGFVTGVYTFRWTSSGSGVCPPKFDDVVITITTPAEAGPNQSFCNTTTFLLQGNEGTEGTWTLTAGAGATIANGPFNTATVTIDPAVTASYTFQYEITNPPAIGGCATTDTVTITNDALPTTPNAGPDQVICTGDTTSAIMAANTIASGSGVWALNSGPNSPPEIGSNDPNVTFTGLIQGLYVFEWVASNGACTNLRDLVRVEMFDPPSQAIISTVDGSTLCQLFSVLEADVSPQAPLFEPFNGIGTWVLTGWPAGYSPGDLEIDNPNNPVTTLTPLNANTLALGTYTFEWRVSIGGSNFPSGSGSACEPSVASVNISYDGLPSAPAVAGNDQTICNLNPSTPETITLTANGINSNDTGVWTLESSTGAIQPQVAISQPGNETTNVSGLTEGVYEFKWSVSNFGGGCTLEDIVTITITNAAADADAGPSQTLPQFSTITMAANNPVPGNGFWSFVSGPTTPSIIDINDPNTLITGTASGVYEFRWTVQNSPCAATSDNVIITILPIVDLSLDKSVNNLSPNVGETVTFTLTIANNGINNGTGINVLDELPTGLALVPGSISNAGIYNAGGNEISWTGLNVADGTSLDLTYQAVVLSTGSYTNTAEITAFNEYDPNSTPGNKDTLPGEDDDDDVTLAPVPIVDISLEKTVNNMTPYVGDNVIFILTVSNDGPSDATGVEVTDYLPDGYTLVSTNASAGSVLGNPTIIWNVGNLANGAEQTLEIVATVTSTGNYGNTAQVTAQVEGDSDSVSNSGVGSNEDDDDAVTPVPLPVADLELEKTVSNAAPNVGETVVFTIRVDNNGPNTATNVHVKDYLPTGFSYFSHTVNTDPDPLPPATEAAYTSVDGNWIIPSIVSGGFTTLEITATVLPTGQYTNFAEIVGADQFDLDSTPGNDDINEDDQDAADIVPINEADLVTTKVVNNANPIEGETITYTIEVLNNGGPTAATGVSLTDILPDGVTYVSHSAQAGTAYNQASGVWTIGNIAVDTTVSLDIVVTVDPGTQGTSIVNNTTAAEGDQTDPNTGGLPDDLDETITVNAFPIAVNDESLGNSAGPVTITDITAPNPTTADSDPDGTIDVTTINLIAPVGALNPVTDGDGDLVGFDVPGEGSWAIDAAGAVTFTPCDGITITAECPAVFTGNPTPIFYTIEDEDGDVSNEASITITYVVVLPIPEDDVSLGNTATAGFVTLDVVDGTTPGAVQDNDADGTVDPTQVSLVPTGTATAVVTNAEGNVTSFTEPGEGTWEVNPTSGAITFTPASGFTLDPTPIDYSIEDNDGNQNTFANNATVTIDYVPVAVDDESLGNTVGSTVTFDIVSNDTDGDLVDPTTINLVVPVGALNQVIDGDGDIVGFDVPNQGTWSVDALGTITFDPIDGFTIDPTPVDYTIEDGEGNETSATVTVSYSEIPPVANDDSVSLVVTGTDAVIVAITGDDTLSDGSPVITNGPGTNAVITLDETSVPGGILNGDGSVTVPGEGTWTYDPATDEMTFSPFPSFTNDPTPITYILTETLTGLSDTAIVSADYIPVPPTANNDEDLANIPGDAVTVDVTGNDVDNDLAPAVGTIDDTTVSLIPSVTATSIVTDAEGDVTSFVEPGQGLWVVDAITGAITFTPVSGFTEDPTIIQYTVDDNDGNISNQATVTIDYIPVAVDDESLGNTVGSTVIFDIVSNDTDGDLVDPTTINLVAPVGALNQVIDGDGDIVGFDVPNQGTWSVDALGTITFDPIDGFTIDPTPIDYTIEDSQLVSGVAPNISTATVTIGYSEIPPVANNDSVSLVVTGTNAVIVDITGDDTLSDGSPVITSGPGTNATITLDASSVAGGIQNSPTQVTVTGEGVWMYDPVADTMTFVPDFGFTADPTPITYILTETLTGLSDTAIVSADYIIYPPIPQDDLSDNGGIGWEPGSAALVKTFIDNGSGTDEDGDAAAGGFVDITSVSLVTPAGALNVVLDAEGDVTSFDVPGEGNWSVDGTNGDVTFTPIATFNDDPTPVDYSIRDNDGNQNLLADNATITIDYAPIATNDYSTPGNVPLTAVDVNIVSNDLDGDIVDPSTIDLDPSSPLTLESILVVPGEGTWEITALGVVTFTPESIANGYGADYTLDPTPIPYTIQDNEGNTSNQAFIYVDYAPIATDDVSDNGGLGHPINTVVPVDVLGDPTTGDTTGDLVDPTTVSLVDPGTAINIVTDGNGDITSFEIPGEGTWNVDLVTGEITFDPEPGFILSPTPIFYNVEDDEGNQSNDAEVEIIYIAQADIQVVKTDNSDTYTPGLPLVYTITVTNNGPADAADVIVNDDIIDPALQAVTTWTGNGSTNVSGDITDDIIATLNVGDIVTYTVTIDVPSSYMGPINNTAIVALPPSTNFTMPVDPDPSNNSSTDVDEMDAQAALVVNKTVDNATPEVGSEVTFTITVTNEGPSDATNIDVLDVLPTGYTLSPDSNPITVSQGIYYPSGPNTGLWDLGNLVDYGDGIAPPIAGSVATLTIRAVVNESGIYTNTAEVVYADQDDPNSIHGNQDPEEDDQDEATTTPIGVTDLVTTKTVDISNPNEGDIVKYTITVVNNGPSAATGVSLIDNLPTGLEYVAHTATGGSVNTYDDVAGDMTWTIGIIDIGESATLTIDALVTAQGTLAQIPITNIVTPASGDQTDSTTVGDDLEEDIIVTASDLVTVKSVSNATPNEGDTITYTIAVTNNGPSNATGVSLTDLLPAGITYVSDDQGGTYNSGSGIWTIGAISSSATATLIITASVDVDTAGMSITNSTTAATGDQSDPTTDGDVLDATIDVDNYTDIVLTKVVDNATPNVGDIVTYTVTVRNNGPAKVTGLVVTDALPTGLTYGIVSPSDGTWAAPNWSIDLLASGEEETIVIEAVVGMDQGGQTLTNTVSNSQNQVDSDLTPDDDTETIVVTSSDLVTVKTVSNATPNEGDTITYTISVTNNGPSDATNISLIDNLPVGITYLSHTLTGGFFNSGSGEWLIEDIASGAMATLEISAMVNVGTGGTVITNYTSAAEGDQSDPDTTTDDLEALITVIDEADIILTKVVDNATPDEGDIVTYTVTVTNNGLAAVTNLVIDDTLPAGLTYGTVTPSIGNWIAPNWEIGILDSGVTESITIEAIVGEGTRGLTLTNVVSNTQDQVDSNNTPDDDSETIVVTSVDLVTTKTISDAAPNEGDVITYTITVTNTLGGSDATNVNLSDNLPVGVTYVSHTTANGLYNEGSGLWSIGNVASGESVVLFINASVDDGTVGQTITNFTTDVIADQADYDTSNNSDSVSIVPVAIIDLSLTKWVVDDVVNPEVGDLITFEIRVSNDGPTEATGVQVTDLIPSGYDFVNYSSTIGTYNPITGLWNIGFIEVGNTAVLLVDVIVMESGDYINCAEITAANEDDIDSTPNNSDVNEDDYDCASAPPYQELDLKVEKTVIADNLTPMVGTEVSFEIRLINDGNIEGTEVVVTDLLPTGYTFLNYSSTRGTYDDDSGKWIVGTIVASETEVLVIDAIVNATGDYLNCAEITEMHQTDTDLSNNTSCIATNPIKIIDLELTKEVALSLGNQGPVSTTGVLQPYAETNVDFTITVSNNGPSDATGVEVTDLLPNGYNFVDATVSIGSYNDDSGIWNIGTIANGASETMIITAFVNPIGNWLNIAEVIAANEFDIDSTPNNGDIFEDDMDQIATEPIIPLTIPEAFSPNGDGINEVFEIEHLQVLYPNFKMEIVDRYGNKVYTYEHDGNAYNTPDWWDGFSNGKLNFNTEQLPAGTYFYTIYFNDDNRRPQTGWVYLRR